jgi:ribosomal-protein-alanine N-acetyltransferase
MSVPVTAASLLETERLRLRGFTDRDADLQLLFELDSDPEVVRFVGPALGPTVEAYRERMRTVWLPYYPANPRQGFWAIMEKDTREFVGWIMLRRATEYRFATEAGWTDPRELELGYRLKRSAWGRGLATEASRELVRLAFADPDVTAVVAAALVPNRASTRVMEKMGMTRLREFATPGYADSSVVYSLSRADYLRMSSSKT